MTPTRCRIESLVTLIQSAFLDDPGLSLTLRDVERRFGLDAVTSAAVLDALTEARVLIERHGVYRRDFRRPAVRPAA